MTTAMFAEMRRCETASRGFAGRKFLIALSCALVLACLVFAVTPLQCFASEGHALKSKEYSLVTTAAKAPVSQSSYTVEAYREAQFGTPPNGNSSDDGQHVRVVLVYNDEVNITDAHAALASLSYAINGRPNIFSEVTVSAQGNTLIVDGGGQKAIFGGELTLSSALLEGVTVGGQQAQIDEIHTLANTGLAIELVEAVPGTASEPAHSTYCVTHTANIRSMNHIVWMTNKNNINADGTSYAILSFDRSSTNGFSQTTTAHHHWFYAFDQDISAYSIFMYAADPSASMTGDSPDETDSSPLSQAGYRVSTNIIANPGAPSVTKRDSGKFTITAKTPVEGEILSVAVFDDTFMQTNNLAFNDEVKNIPTPKINDDSSNGESGSDNEPSTGSGSDDSSNQPSSDQSSSGDSVPFIVEAGNTGVTATGATRASKQTKLEVSSLSEGANYAALNSIIGLAGKNMLSAYDLKLFVDGVQVHEGFGTVTISFPVDRALNGKTVTLFNRTGPGATTAEDLLVTDNKVTATFTSFQAIALAANPEDMPINNAVQGSSNQNVNPRQPFAGNNLGQGSHIAAANNQSVNPAQSFAGNNPAQGPNTSATAKTGDNNTVLAGLLLALGASVYAASLSWCVGRKLQKCSKN